MTATHYGRVGGDLAEALAYLNSPARIDGEIRRLERAIGAGDTSEATATLLADWRAVKAAQRGLLAQENDTTGEGNR